MEMYVQAESPTSSECATPKTSDIVQPAVAKDDDSIAAVENKAKSANLRVLMATLLVMVLVSAAGGIIYLYFVSAKGSESGGAAKIDDLQDYVLPNTSVVVLEATNSSISGEFSANDVSYEFSSFPDTISFRKV